LKYVNEAVAGQAKAADFEKTMVLRPGSMKAPTAAPAASAPAGAAAPWRRLPWRPPQAQEI